MLGTPVAVEGGGRGGGSEVGVLVLHLSVGLTSGVARRECPKGASPGPDSWIWEEGWEMGGATIDWLWLMVEQKKGLRGQRALFWTLGLAVLLSGPQSPHL